jgi:hypothetical protein
MKIISSFLLILVLFMACGNCWADVVEPGNKEISLSYQILNINDYPDYVFLFHGTPEPAFQVINDSEFSFYKFSQISIYAMKKSDFNLSELEKMNYTQRDSFFENDNRLIKSNISLNGSYGTVAQNNPLENAKIVLEIESINENQMIINKKYITYYFENGSSEKVNFNNQKIIPQPPINNSSGFPIYYLILSIALTLILISLILFIIRKK